MVTDRTVPKFITLTIPSSDLDELIEVLKRCADDYCGTRQQNILDLRMQQLRFEQLRDDVDPPPTRRDSNRAMGTTVVDPDGPTPPTPRRR